MTELYLSNLKYLVFFAALFLGVPTAYVLSVRNPTIERIVFFLMIFFTAQMEDINFLSHETYKGTSLGFEFGMVDLATLVIFFVVLNRRRRFGIRLVPPGSVLYFLYFLFSLLSIVNAQNYLYSAFELWSMIKMYFYFWVIYNYIKDLKDLDFVMKSISLVILFIGIIVLKQKYIEGHFHCRGPFPHHNSMVMYLMIFTSIVFAYVLNKKRKINLTYWLFILALGIGSIISSYSRAGQASFVVASSIVLFFSFAGGLSAKKLSISFILMIAGIVMLAKAADSIIIRFVTAPAASANLLILLAQAAVRMADDKTFGVGLNNWGIKVNPPYPYSDHIEGTTEDSRHARVETIYLMIAAETGWYNLVVFLLLIFYYYFRNFYNYFRFQKTDYHYYTIGLMGGLLGIYLESSLEWVLKQTNNFYQLMMAFALIAAMSKIEKKYSKQTGKTRRVSYVR